MATVSPVTSTISECQPSNWHVDMLVSDNEGIIGDAKYEPFDDDMSQPLEDEDESFGPTCSFSHNTIDDYGDALHSTQFGHLEGHASPDEEGHCDSDVEELGEMNLSDHPFLNMDEQRINIRNHKLEKHVKWTETMSDAQRLSHFNRKVAIKILVSEAQSRDESNTAKMMARQAHERCRLRVDARMQLVRFEKEREGDSFDVETLRDTISNEMRDIHKEDDACQSDEAVRTVRVLWKSIADKVMEEMYFFDNSSLVLKNMSCMCVFIPENICREYGDNLFLRQARVANQHALLDRLGHERRKFVNGPSEYDMSVEDAPDKEVHNIYEGRDDEYDINNHIVNKTGCDSFTVSITE